MSDSEEKLRVRRDRDSRNDKTRDRSNDRNREPRSMKSSSNRVYVSNIPYEFRWQEVKDLFRDEVGDVQFVELFFDEHDKPKGCGIVEFSDHASVKKCIEVMQRFEVSGRKLVIKEDSGVTRDRHGVIISGGGGGRRNDKYRDDYNRNNFNLRKDEGKWGNTYGLSPQFLESLKIDPPLVNRVFVANLDYNIDKKKLKEVFKLAGKVVRVDIPVDKEGSSRGFAIVEYDHPVEAVQAISMFHNQVYYERTLTVRMDRVNETLRLPEGLKSIGMGLGPNGEPLKCVAHNLPSLNNNSLYANALLGSVQNFQLANSLSSLNSISSLTLKQQALQTGINNYLAQNLGSNNNNITHSQSQQLSSSIVSKNPPNLSLGNTMSNYTTKGTVDYNNFNNNQSSMGYETNSNSNNGYATNSNSNIGSNPNRGYATNDNSNLQYNTLGGTDIGNDTKSFTKKVLISNLPTSVSYKLLSEKLSEFGDIVSFDPKSAGTFVLTYATECQADRAIKNLDRARIDGKMIEARPYY